MSMSTFPRDGKAFLMSRMFRECSAKRSERDVLDKGRGSTGMRERVSGIATKWLQCILEDE